MGWLKSASRRNSLFFIAGALAVGGSLFAIACSTDNGNADDDPLPVPDGSRADRSTGGGDGSPEPETDGGVKPVSDASIDCGEVPFLPNNASGYYCPFKDRDAGDGGRLPSTCGNAETCCSPNQVNGQFPPAFCATSKTANACQTQATQFNSNWSTSGSVWQCGDKRNCGSGESCCMTTRPDAGTNKVNIGATNNTDWPKACGVLEAYQWGGTACKNTCATDELKLCNEQSDCSANQKCTPFFVQVGSRYFGYCR